MSPASNAPTGTPLPVPKITPQDVVIAVMGLTGVGKSTFISHFSDTAVVGDSLEACTSAVGVHEAHVGNQKIFLIDTPGFDDTYRSDTEILREVADWLGQAYNQQIQLSGIVYLHRISDDRVGGSAMKNLRMFKKLCGPKALSSVVLATTMWENVPKNTAESREKQLMSEESFWAEMIKQGSKVMRQDEGEVSAVNILHYILSNRKRIVMEIQKEMAAGKTLDQTDAGKEVEAQLEAQKRRHEADMRELRKEMQEAMMQKDKTAQDEIRKMKAELEAKMQKDKEDREKMRVNMEKLQKEREQELAQERERNNQMHMEHQQQMLTAQYDLEKLRITSDHNLQLAKQQHRADVAEAEARRLQKKQESDCRIM